VELPVHPEPVGLVVHDKPHDEAHDKAHDEAHDDAEQVVVHGLEDVFFVHDNRERFQS
jgi:hypothetical protein